MRFICLLVPFLLLLSACGSDVKVEREYPQEIPGGSRYDPFAKKGEYDGQGIFGEDGLTLFGGGSENASGGGIGVNGYLWRASLDTLAFMPLVSADPFGGVIITDWYAGADVPDERVKMTVYILDTRLRADGVRVNVFRQARREDGSWVDAQVSPDTPTMIENAILTRARQLRVDSIQK